ncbi:MAG: heme exporter protein CcmD [Hyphomicrobiales bacterium]
MFFDDQNGYITASYVVTALVFIVLTFWVFSDRKKQKKALNELEQHGITRHDKEKTGQ